MSQGAPYPITIVLRRLLEEAGLDRDGLILALGYRNLQRGRRRLDAWMDQGEGYERIIKQIAAAYPGHADALHSAVAAMPEIKKAEWDVAFLERCKAEEGTFRPYVHADAESTRPSSICMYGLTGGRWNYIEIPQATLDSPIEEQLAELPALMLAYRQRHNGFCPFFGKLTGFKFVRLLDYYQFDAEGRFLEHVGKPFRRGTCSVGLY